MHQAWMLVLLFHAGAFLEGATVASRPLPPQSADAASVGAMMEALRPELTRWPFADPAMDLDRGAPRELAIRMWG